MVKQEAGVSFSELTEAEKRLPRDIEKELAEVVFAENRNNAIFKKTIDPSEYIGRQRVMLRGHCFEKAVKLAVIKNEVLSNEEALRYSETLVDLSNHPENFGFGEGAIFRNPDLVFLEIQTEHKKILIQRLGEVKSIEINKRALRQSGGLRQDVIDILSREDLSQIQQRDLINETHKGVSAREGIYAMTQMLKPVLLDEELCLQHSLDPSKFVGYTIELDPNAGMRLYIPAEFKLPDFDSLPNLRGVTYEQFKDKSDLTEHPEVRKLRKCIEEKRLDITYEVIKMYQNGDLEVQSIDVNRGTMCEFADSVLEKHEKVLRTAHGFFHEMLSPDEEKNVGAYIWGMLKRGDSFEDTDKYIGDIPMDKYLDSWRFILGLCTGEPLLGKLEERTKEVYDYLVERYSHVL